MGRHQEGAGLGNDTLRHSEGISLPHESMPIREIIFFESFLLARIGISDPDTVDLVFGMDVPQQRQVKCPDGAIGFRMFQGEQCRYEWRPSKIKKSRRGSMMLHQSKPFQLVVYWRIN